MITPQQAREIEQAARELARAQGEAIRVAAHHGDTSAALDAWTAARKGFLDALDAATDWSAAPTRT